MSAFAIRMRYLENRLASVGVTLLCFRFPVTLNTVQSGREEKAECFHRIITCKCVCVVREG